MGIQNYFTIQITSLIFSRYPDSRKMHMHMAEVNRGDTVFPVVWLTATTKEKSAIEPILLQKKKRFSGECFALSCVRYCGNSVKGVPVIAI